MQNQHSGFILMITTITPTNVIINTGSLSHDKQQHTCSITLLLKSQKDFKLKCTNTDALE